MGEAIMVGIAEAKITRSQDDVLMALGLGSSVAVCAYDLKARVAGMAYILLPDSAGVDANPCKYADTAIPHLIELMIHRGGAANRIHTAIVGGAQLFALNGSGPRLEIGARNTAAIKAALDLSGLKLTAVDVGGSASRTVHLSGDGRIRVKVPGKGERELVSLGNLDLALLLEKGVAALCSPGLDTMQPARE